MFSGDRKETIMRFYPENRRRRIFFPIVNGPQDHRRLP